MNNRLTWNPRWRIWSNAKYSTGISIITWFDGMHSLIPPSFKKCRLQYGMMVRNVSKTKSIACYCVSIEASSNLLTTTMHGFDSWCLCCVVSKVWSTWLEWLHLISITVAQFLGQSMWKIGGCWFPPKLGTWSPPSKRYSMMSVLWTKMAVSSPCSPHVCQYVCLFWKRR